MTSRQPSLPLHRRPRRRTLDPEARLQRAVIGHLKLAATGPVIWFHPPNGMKTTESQASDMKAIGMLPGVADLVIVTPGGGAHFLELKAKGRKQSPAQAAFEALCIENGAPYAVADCIERALDILRDWGVIKFEGSARWPHVRRAHDKTAV